MDVTVGMPVTFALNKNTMYVRDADGTEHKLRVTKKVPNPKSQPGRSPAREVNHEFAERLAQVGLAEKHEAVEAFFPL